MKKKLISITLLLLITVIYYQIDYKRYIIYNKDKTKCFTIWKRYSHTSYIIDGEYLSPLKPQSNYILIKNQKIGVIFNTNDNFNYKLSLCSKEFKDYNNKVEIYSQNDSLLKKYEILLESNAFKRKYSDSKNDLINVYDYKLIDLKRIYGIKVLVGHSE